MSLHYSNEDNKLQENVCFVGVGVKVAIKLPYEQIQGNVSMTFISEDLYEPYVFIYE